VRGGDSPAGAAGAVLMACTIRALAPCSRARRPVAHAVYNAGVRTLQVVISDSDGMMDQSIVKIVFLTFLILSYHLDPVLSVFGLFSKHPVK
jgi:hypothetical protein